MDKRFNVRVYGILIDGENRVLLSFEQYKQHVFTKFPGGGLEYGEGTLDALKREFREELGIEPFNFRHFYTTDFFQQSAFNDSQVISIYYLVTIADFASIPQLSDTGTVYFYPIDATLPDEVDLPIDKVVAEMLVAHERESLKGTGFS